VEKLVTNVENRFFLEVTTASTYFNHAAAVC